MNKSTIALLALGIIAGTAGCQNAPPATSALEDQHSEIILSEGDVIRISFPGTSGLDIGEQPIRRDGKITLGSFGEMSAVGFTPTELQNQILAKVSDQLLSKEVVVTVVSSTFSVYVDGPVGRPGKVVADHRLTIMEAIMEAGGFNYQTADTKHVEILRHKGSSKTYSYITLNLQQVLDGEQKDLFYLEPGDIIHVAQKFSWF